MVGDDHHGGSLVGQREQFPEHPHVRNGGAHWDFGHACRSLGLNGRAAEAFGGVPGRLDVVVANAGFGVAGAVHKLSIEDFRRQFETNVFGVLRTVQATREALIATRGGIAIMGSVMSYIALPISAPYSMSKHAVRALAGALRAEVSKYGVAVTLLAPGFVDSEIRQVDNRGQYSEENADPIPAWLSMDTDKAAARLVKGILKRKRVVVITGHGKLFVFLERHAPWLTAFLARRLGINQRRQGGE